MPIGYLLFPTLIIILVQGLFFSFHLTLLLCVLFLIIRIIFMENKKILYLTIILMLFFCIYFTFIIQKEKNKENMIPLGEQKRTVQVIPDTIQLSQYTVQCIGIDINTNNKIKVIVLKKAETVRLWKQLAQPIYITIDGKIEKPETERNLNGFNQNQYLRNKNIYYTMQAETILFNKKITLKCSVKKKIQLFFSILRRKSEIYLENRFPTYMSMYMKSLFLGKKDQEFQLLANSFENLSIFYLFTISSIQFTGIMTGFYFILAKAKLVKADFWWLEIIIVASCWFFWGGGVNLMRVISWHIINQVTYYKQYRWGNLDKWSIVLLVTLIIYPRSLLTLEGQISFTMSFLTLYYQPLLSINTNKNLSIQLRWISVWGSLPIIAFHTYEVSLIQWLILGILRPLMTYILFPVFLISITISKIFNLKSTFSGYQVFEIALETFQFFLKWLDKFSFFTITTGKISILLIIISYFLLWNTWRVRFTSFRWKRVFFLFIIQIVFFVISKYIIFTGTFSMIDIGQGDSLFIQSPFQKETILIDTGGQKEYRNSFNKKIESYKNKMGLDLPSKASYSVIPYLKSQGVSKIKRVFITHSHEDHFKDLLAIHKSIPVKTVYISSGAIKQKNIQTTLQTLIKDKVKIVVITAPKTIVKTNSLALKLMAPNKEGNGGNNDSLIMKAYLKPYTILLTGDLEASGEQELLQKKINLKADILKVGHHGSRTSSTNEFLQQINPKWAFISCGKNNSFGHPHLEIINRLETANIQIYRTDKQGMICFRWGNLISKKIIKTVLSP